jgi:hypothetical protein
MSTSKPNFWTIPLEELAQLSVGTYMGKYGQTDPALAKEIFQARVQLETADKARSAAKSAALAAWALLVVHTGPRGNRDHSAELRLPGRVPWSS